MPATPTKRSAMMFPFPLGKLMPGANYATASVPLTANFQPVEQDGVTPAVLFGTLKIRAAAANTGTIYICNSAANPSETNYSNVIDALQKDEVFLLGRDWGAQVFINQIWIGADNATDFAIASIAEN